MNTDLPKKGAFSLKFFFGLFLFCAGLWGCATPNPVHRFMDQQKEKIVKRKVTIQADPLFTAHLYRPTREDLEGLKAAWREHARAFPESAEIKRVEDALQEPGAQVLLIALYSPDIDGADLRNKSLGWSLHPMPRKIDELKNSDLVLRALFPLENTWMRYFLLQYGSSADVAPGGTLVLGLPEKSVELPVL